MVWFCCLDQVVWRQFPWTKTRTRCDLLGLVDLRGRRGQTLTLAQGALNYWLFNYWLFNLWFCFLLASYFIAEPESGTGCPEFLASDQEIYGRNSFYSILFCILHTSYCYCCKLTPMAGRRPYWPVKGDALALMNGRSGVTRWYILALALV